MPLVSVVIPVYNYARFLPQAAESLLAQTETDWDCWLVDDGSTDDTQAVCEALVRRDGRFHYLFQAHRGLPAARNLGLRHARGNFIQFLDADDRLEPRKLSAQCRFLNEHPEIDIVYGEAFYEDGKSRTSAVFSDCRHGALPSFVRENAAAVNAFLMRRSVLEEAGPLDESLEAYEDWDFWLRCALKKKTFSYAPAGEDAAAVVRTHSGSMIQNRLKMLSALVAVRRKIAPLLPEGEARKINRHFLIRDEGRLALEELKAGATPGRLARIVRAAARELVPGRPRVRRDGRAPE